MFDGGEHPDCGVRSHGVVPVDPLGSGDLDVVDGRPESLVADELGLVQRVPLDNDVAQGNWDCPYRPTPLQYEVDGKKYFNERPTSTQQTGFSYVAQLRSWLPRELGGILWFGNDDGNMIAYVPIYCSNTERAECFNTPGADAVTFSDKNAFWVCNWVSNMVYPRYSQLFPSLKAVRDSLENAYFAAQPEVETKALSLYKTDKVGCSEVS